MHGAAFNGICTYVNAHQGPSAYYFQMDCNLLFRPSYIVTLLPVRKRTHIGAHAHLYCGLHYEICQLDIIAMQI